MSVPADAPEESEDDKPTRRQFVAALPDAWLLVHGVFSDLRKGVITAERAVGEIERIANRAAQDELELFTQYPMYSASHESVALAELLRTAARRIRERYGLK